MKTTCCVPHCNSRRSKVKLHRFPQSDIGLQKWVKSINCALLNGLESKELRKLFVCHKHFEKQFVTNSLRLRHLSYPTLFTNEELDTGKPEPHRKFNLFNKDVEIRKRGHEDHSYNKPIQNIQQSEDQFERYKLSSVSDMEAEFYCKVSSSSSIIKNNGTKLANGENSAL